jgi:hypothetical protein
MSSSPRLVELTQAEFDSLGEYSTSIPTGKTVGKRWKRNVNCGGLRFENKVDETEARMLGPEWWLGEYKEDEPPSPDHVLIVWSKIVIKEK